MAKTFKSGGLVANLCLTLMILRTIACQNPLSVEFSRQEYWSGLPFPSPGDLSNPGIKPRTPALQEDYLPLSQQGSPTNMQEIVKSFGFVI